MIGLFVRFGIVDDTDGILTQQEIAEGYGFLSFSIEDGKFKLVPECPMTEDGKLNINEDWDVGDFAAHSLGYSNIVVKKGIYTVNSSGGPFGSVLFDFIGTK